MREYHEDTNRLLKLLQDKDNTRSIYLDRINNHAIRADFSEDTFYLEHNIGGMKRPTKTEARVLLEGLVNYYKNLCEDRVDLRIFLEDKKFVAALVVFSGQMDFKIASWKKGIITWHTELEN